ATGPLIALALEDDLVGDPACRELQDLAARDAVPHAVPAARALWIEEAHRRAVTGERFAALRLLRRRRDHPDVLYRVPTQHPAEVPLAGALLLRTVRLVVDDIEYPIADKLTEEHEVLSGLGCGTGCI